MEVKWGGGGIGREGKYRCGWNLERKGDGSWNKGKEMEVGTFRPLAPSVLSLINIINIFSSNGILCVFVFLSFFFRYNAVGSPVDSAHSITVALRDLYKIMDKTPESLPPIIFLQV